MAEETTNAAVAQEATPTGEAATVQQPVIEDQPTAVQQPTVTMEGPTTAAFPPVPPLPPDSVADADAEDNEGGRGIRWPVVAGTAAIIFVLSLAFVTTVELVAGRPLADLFGGHVKGGQSVHREDLREPAVRPRPR